MSGTAHVDGHRAGQVVFAEPAQTSDGEGERHGDEARATVLTRGLFDAECRAEFHFRVYASWVRELHGFLAGADAPARQEGSETTDAYEPDLYGRVERMAAGATGTEIAYHQRAVWRQLGVTDVGSFVRLRHLSSR